MPATSNRLAERSTALVTAISGERHQSLLATIQQIREDMNARSILFSSVYVNEVSQACTSELREIAKIVWEKLKIAHESCGSKTSEDLLPLFRRLLEREMTKLDQIRDGAVRDIARQLQNQSFIQLNGLSETYERLLGQYEAEIEIYVDNFKRSSGATFSDRLRSGFMNSPLIAAGVLVVIVIVAIGSFSDALRRLDGFFRGMLGIT